ncbi:carbohydrate ABC transporter permease [Streptomyces iranensis]|uniref:ABC-type sugar transport system permease subunit n=1 Tax=Streptomyces iranensis TaxID=576784 RepID=A0ABS4N8X5_9ACTN|nr:sugar ABC transporter permease [Streptomyces iranensis]MBP2068486.1 ABC-type sugar transport system permease subunit [Streptomyces iranensis]
MSLVRADAPAPSQPVAEKAARPTDRKREGSWSAYALLLPAGVFYVSFQLFPILVAFALSFFSWDGIDIRQAKFLGLANYVTLVHDGLLWRSVWHNLVVALAVLIIQCVGSFVIAAIIQAGIKGGRFFRLVFFAPVVISSVAVGMLAIFVFSPSQGLVNEALSAIGLGGLRQPWLGSGTWALPAVIATYILQNFGLSVLLFISGLGQVDQDLLEAAELDGASQGRILWQVVFPVIRPVTTTVFLLGLVTGFKLFDTVYVMTAGGPFHASDTIVTYLYGVSFGGNDIGYGNAIGVLLFVILLVIALIQLRLTRTGKETE